jgi:hypothetical protein
MLDYSIDPSWKRQWTSRDLRSADEMELRYDCFLGDISFEINGTDFSARWGWVPVLDFALALRAITSALAESDHETFEFTESDATIEFTKRNGKIRLEAGYADASADVDYAELSLEAERFAARLLRELGEEHPGLRENPLIEELSRSLSSTP